MIGVLVLFICFIVLSQIDEKAIEEVRATVQKDQISQAEFDRLNAELADAREDLKRSNFELETADNPTSLPELRAEVEALENDVKILRETEPDVSADAASLEAQIKQLKLQNQTTIASLQKIEEDAKERVAGPLPAAVKIRPSGSGLAGAVKPVFVECANDGLTVYEATPWDVPRAQLTKHPRFDKLIKTLADKPKASIIFLVRENATPVYNAASRHATNNYCKNGKLPVIGMGPIDLSAFKK